MNTPITVLTLSAEPQDLRVRWGSVAERSEDRLDASDEAYTALLPEDRDAVVRLLDTRRRIQARMWAARAEAIRAQLRAQRGTWA